MSRKSTKTESSGTLSKTKIGLPDLDQAKASVLSSLGSPESRRGYQHAMEEFIDWYCSEPRLSFNKTVVTRYRIHLESRQLAPGTSNVRLAAVRRLAYEAADSGLPSPELAAAIRRVKGAKKLGVRLGNWLTAEEARTLWQLPNPETLKGKRDRAILATLSGCGLLRREFAELTLDQLQRREDHWAIVDLVGKGGHVRTVPVPDWVKTNHRHLAHRCRGYERENIPLRLFEREPPGATASPGKSSACRQGLRRQARSLRSRAPRPSAILRTPLLRSRWRAGTDSAPAGPLPRPSSAVDRQSSHGAITSEV